MGTIWNLLFCLDKNGTGSIIRFLVFFRQKDRQTLRMDYSQENLVGVNKDHCNCVHLCSFLERFSFNISSVGFCFGENLINFIFECFF
jgi:hypothetical protein